MLIGAAVALGGQAIGGGALFGEFGKRREAVGLPVLSRTVSQAIRAELITSERLLCAGSGRNAVYTLAALQ
jgi:hypothetical protein